MVRLLGLCRHRAWHQAPAAGWVCAVEVSVGKEIGKEATRVPIELMTRKSREVNARGSVDPLAIGE
jgi:hypothetical protein